MAHAGAHPERPITGQVIVDELGHHGQIVGVDQLSPLLRLMVERLVVEAEEEQPARIVGLDTGPEIPVHDSVLGRVHQQVEQARFVERQLELWQRTRRARRGMLRCGDAGKG
jgi:hypothetical protein